MPNTPKRAVTTVYDAAGEDTAVRMKSARLRLIYGEEETRFAVEGASPSCIKIVMIVVL